MVLGVETYNANDFIKDKFTENEVKYLPIKYDDTDEKITVADIEREFTARGLKIESISSNKITNGTQIKTANATYTVIIYGDADGDGEVNVFDARQIVEWLLYEKEHSVSEITRLASNVDNEKEDVLDIFDARRIVEFSLGMNSIIDTMPESDISKDKEAPEITLIGEKEVSIKVFEEYKDLGAIAKDNLDETIGDKIVVDTSKVNTNVPGDYEVTYNVTDASGNKAKTIKRIVHVEDYVTDIEIDRYPKLQYVVGQDITIDNMVAYEILAYGGKSNKQIDVKEVKYTPTKATEDMIGTTEIVLEYKGVKKRITIEVQERVPIITLTGHNGSTDVKIRLGEDYIEGATAFDEIDQKQLQVFISGTVDKNTEGKYTITYTSEPNSLGKVGKVVRTVEVCDYVTDVDFELDDSKFKKDYIEGQTISLEGISAILTKASGKTETVTNGLKASEEKAVYDRKVESNNTDRELEVTYTAIDPVDGTSTVYKSTDKLSDIRINVTKQFETVNVIGSTVERGEIFADNLVATVEQGTNEDDISIDKLEVKVTPTEKDEHGCETKAWLEESNTEPGALDVHFRGIKDNTRYTITLTPKTDSKYKQAKTFTFITTGSNEVNSVKINGIKKADGKALEEFRRDNGEIVNGFKVGESIVADLSLFHNYQYNGHKHEVELSNVPVDKINAKVIDDLNTETEVTGITTRVVEKEGKLVVEINSATNAPSNKNGTKIIIKVTAIDPNDATNNYSSTREIYIFEKSKYTVQLNEDSKQDITLSLKDIKTSNGYEMKKFGNDVYTLLPVSIRDQYNNEKDITANDISTDNADIQNGKLVFYDGITTASGKNYIKTIALKSKTEEAKAGDKVKFVGIAIRDLPEIASEEDLLETKTIKVYFEKNQVREYSTIKILRKDISNLEYTKDTDANHDAGEVECYDDIAIGKVKSGSRQEALTVRDLSRIGIIVKKGNGTPEKLIDTNGTTSSKPNEVELISKNKDFGASIVFEGDGEVAISFWAKNEGTLDNKYLITPYIVIGEGSNRTEKVMDEGKYVTVIENEEVNKVTFTDENGTELQEGKFGTVDFGPEVNKTLKVNFYHKYEKAIDKIGEADNRIITNVKRSEVRTPKATDANNQIDKTFIIITKGGKDYETENVDDNNTLNPSIKDDYVTKISVALKENADTTGTVKFSVIVNNDTFDFTGTVGRRLEVDSVEFGTAEQKANGIKIYTKSEADSAELRAKLASKEVIKGDDDIYYTVVPIKFKSGTREIGSNIKADDISNTPDATIYLEDNLKDSDLGIVVQAIGLDKDRRQVSGEKDIYYIGIGVMSDYYEYVFGGNTDLGPLSLDDCSIKCKFNFTNQAGSQETFNKTFKFNITSDYND